MPTLVNATEEKTEHDKARFNLKNQNIQANLDKDTGNLTFVVPKSLEKKLQKEYNFSIDMLSVGGDIPLPELAIHCDEQASTEARIAFLAEFVRYQLKQKQDQYDAWYWSSFNKVKQHLKENDEKNLTDKSVEGRIKSKYKEKYLKFKTAINTLEMQFRILNNVIKASLVTKGSMLPSIRLIIQGKDGQGIGTIKPKIAKKVRKKLKIV